MDYNKEMKLQFEKLLKKPNQIEAEHIPFLQNCIKQYPYFQLGHLLLAKAAQNSNNQALSTKAALYNKGGLVHKILYSPAQLALAEHLQVAYTEELLLPAANLAQAKDTEVPVFESTAESTVEIDTETPSDTPEAEFEAAEQPEFATEDQALPITERIEDQAIVVEPIEEVTIATDVQHVTTPQTEAFVEAQTATYADIETTTIEFDHSTNENYQEEQTNNTETTVAPLIENLPPIEEELEKIFGEKHRNTESEQKTEEHFFVVDAEPSLVATQTEEVVGNTKEPWEIESLATSNFFALDEDFKESSNNTTEAKEQLASEKAATLSMYNDDKMPYSFLWWLSKTRQNHESAYQSFAQSTSSTQKTDKNLQHQYAEHIFSFQSPISQIENEIVETQDPNNTNGAKPSRKEDEIIDNFIKNDPQIKAPKPDQINNENKAKHSSEDRYELVSETLAHIYLDQMLYHKAIDTYRKLSLKFPEKSRYFADLIKQLEKKN